MKLIQNGLRELIALVPYSLVATPCLRLFQRSLRVSLGTGVKLIGGVYVGPNVRIGDNVKIFRGACITGGEARTEIGADSFVGRGVFIETAADVIIGKHVALGPDVHIFTHDSVLHWLSNHRIEMANGSVRIEDNCYVGTGACILKGVTIGENSVVGASALVTRDVPANSVVMGQPAKLYCTTMDLFQRAGVDPARFLRRG